MKKHLESYAFLLTIAGLVISLDQWTKCLVRSNLAIQESWSPWEWLAPYARIVHWKNTGAAFGMFQDMNLVFAALAVVVTLAIMIFFPRVAQHEWPLRLALAMQMGGAVGNLIDRLTQGYVTDFVSLGTFAVFNVADASISVGVAVLVVGVWLSEMKLRREAELPVDGAALETEEPGEVVTEEPAAEEPASEEPASEDAVSQEADPEEELPIE